MKFLFVCMGNICRSPVVEAVARARFALAGLDIEVDSAGTEDYHIGEPPDRRSLASALARGYDASAHRARQVEAGDFARFDKLLVMDRTNLRALTRRAPGAGSARIALFLPWAGIDEPHDLPDPYYGQARDFDTVVTLAERGIHAIVAAIQSKAKSPDSLSFPHRRDHKHAGMTK
ncbi:MAG: low molecular weight phosphotyrosine protein phosphatase [Rhodanobacter sp.]|jgi:protein-tyrosine phosphatase|nr:low molecular weight phosphotyrosine protein phosphatase [Rhodanobacter sp.]